MGQQAPAALIRTAGELGLLAPERARVLSYAHELFTNVTQVLNVLVDKTYTPQEESEAVRQRLAAAAGLPGFAQLDGELTEARRRVREVFEDVIG